MCVHERKKKKNIFKPHDNNPGNMIKASSRRTKKKKKRGSEKKKEKRKKRIFISGEIKSKKAKFWAEIFPWNNGPLPPELDIIEMRRVSVWYLSIYIYALPHDSLIIIIIII